MKIYLASSWKNQGWLESLAEMFRSWGHEVDLFCDPSTGRYVFSWRELGKDIEQIDAVEFLDDPRTQKAYQEDKKWIEWADAVVMVYPCGNSSHLEAGYAKGIGKKLYIIGSWPPGVFDVMYGFADRVFHLSEIDELGAELAGVKA